MGEYQLSEAPLMRILRPRSEFRRRLVRWRGRARPQYRRAASTRSYDALLSKRNFQRSGVGKTEGSTSESLVAEKPARVANIVSSPGCCRMLGKGRRCGSPSLKPISFRSGGLVERLQVT